MPQLDDPAAAFAGDVLHRGQRAFAVVVGGRHVDLQALRIQRVARQRHVAFPADQRADTTDRRVHHLSPDASPKPHTMRSGLVGISLRWRLISSPSGADHDHAVVDGAAAGPCRRSSMPHTIVTPCSCAASLQRREVLRGQVHRLRRPQRVDLLGQPHVGPGAQAPDPRRITRHERFGEHQQLRAFACGLLHRGHRGAQRGLAVEPHRRALDHRHAGHRAHPTWPASTHFSPSTWPSRTIVIVPSRRLPRTTPCQRSKPYFGLSVSALNDSASPIGCTV